jgi:hypothetical protein
VTRRPISRQLTKYEHATIEKVLEEVISVWYAPYPVLGNEPINTRLQQYATRMKGIFYRSAPRLFARQLRGNASTKIERLRFLCCVVGAEEI